VALTLKKFCTASPGAVAIKSPPRSAFRRALSYLSPVGEVKKSPPMFVGFFFALLRRMFLRMTAAVIDRSNARPPEIKQEKYHVEVP
jgi:hypothetical protein